MSEMLLSFDDLKLMCPGIAEWERFPEEVAEEFNCFTEPELAVIYAPSLAAWTFEDDGKAQAFLNKWGVSLSDRTANVNATVPIRGPAHLYFAALHAVEQLRR